MKIREEEYVFMSELKAVSGALAILQLCYSKDDLVIDAKKLLFQREIEMRAEMLE